MKFPVLIILCVVIFLFVFVAGGRLTHPAIAPQEAFQNEDYKTVVMLLNGKIRLDAEEKEMLYLSKAHLAHDLGDLSDALGQLNRLKSRQDADVQTLFEQYVSEYLDQAIARGSADLILSLSEHYPEVETQIQTVFTQKCIALDHQAIALAAQLIEAQPDSALSVGLTDGLAQAEYWIPSLSDGRLIYQDASYTNVQGLCTDREGAVFVACREGGTGAKYDASPTMLRKFDTSGNLIASNNNACYCHANGMTYCTADGKLYIATLGNVANVTDPEFIYDPQNENVIAVVNSETLELEQYISVRDQMRSIGTVYRSKKYTDARISAVHYDAYEDQFICLLSPYYSDNSMQQKYRGFAFFDREWNLIRYVPIEDHASMKIILGSITSDEQYFYISAHVTGTQNRMLVFDRSCNFLGSWKLNSLTTQEFECADFIGTTLYASLNTKPISVEAYDIGETKSVSLLAAMQRGARIETDD